MLKSVITTKIIFPQTIKFDGTVLVKDGGAFLASLIFKSTKNNNRGKSRPVAPREVALWGRDEMGGFREPPSPHLQITRGHGSRHANSQAPRSGDEGMIGGTCSPGEGQRRPWEKALGGAHRVRGRKGHRASKYLAF